MPTKVRLRVARERQEIFDRVAVHLIRQNKKSTRLDSQFCLYKSGELSCAIGCLISDDEYDKNIEQENVNSKIVLKAIHLSNLGLHNLKDMVQFLEKLQVIHDATEVCQWENALRLVAHYDHLSTAALDEYISENKKGLIISEGLTNLRLAMQKQQNEDDKL